MPTKKQARPARPTPRPAPAGQPAKIPFWRLPFSGRLHANRDCRLLHLEHTLPSPMHYHASLLDRSDNRPRREERSLQAVKAAASQLCTCARHLLG